MTKAEKRAPVLRFKGFNEDWEQRKLFDNIESTIDFRGRTPKKLGMDWSDSGYLALSALNVKNGYIDPSVDAHYGSEELYKKWMGGKELQKGQVLFTMEAPMGNVAQVPDNRGYILSQRTVSFEADDKKMTNDFLAILLRTPRVFNDLTALSSGGTAKGVSQKSLSSLKVIVPRNLIEQKKLATLIKYLEETITLHQEKLNKLDKLKLALLQKIFPLNGQTKPMLRFTNFDSEWEQRKLKEVIDNHYNGQTPSRLKAEFWNGEINWLSSGELNRAVVSKTIEKITEAGKNSANLKVVPKGTFVMAITGLEATGTRGNCAILGVDTTLNQSCMALFPNNKVLSSEFLFQWYRKYGQEYGIRYTQGTKQQSYNAELLEILPITLPNVKEQMLISKILNKLDDTIALHQLKLEKIQSLKKSYLQKMFI